LTPVRIGIGDIGSLSFVKVFEVFQEPLFNLRLVHNMTKEQQRIVNKQRLLRVLDPSLDLVIRHKGER